MQAKHCGFISRHTTPIIMKITKKDQLVASMVRTLAVQAWLDFKPHNPEKVEPVPRVDPQPPPTLWHTTQISGKGWLKCGTGGRLCTAGGV